MLSAYQPSHRLSDDSSPPLSFQGMRHQRQQQQTQKCITGGRSRPSFRIGSRWVGRLHHIAAQSAYGGSRDCLGLYGMFCIDWKKAKNVKDQSQVGLYGARGQKWLCGLGAVVSAGASIAVALARCWRCDDRVKTIVH